MKNKQYFKTLILFVFGMIFFVNSSHAMNCFEKSPNYKDLEDEYFNIEKTREFSDKEKDLLNDVLKKAEGKWKGFSKEINCKGSDKHPRQEIKKADLIAQTRYMSSGDLSIQLEKYFSEDKIRKIQTINLFKGVRVFEFNFKGESGFTFSERYRRMIANGKTRLVEIIRDIEIKEKRLVLKTAVFVNGVYVSEEIFTLSAI